MSFCFSPFFTHCYLSWALREGCAVLGKTRERRRQVEKNKKKRKKKKKFPQSEGKVVLYGMNEWEKRGLIGGERCCSRALPMEDFVSLSF